MRSTVLTLLGLALAFPASAATILSWDSGFANDGRIPDGNTTGWWDSRLVEDLLGQIGDIKVTVTLSGGFNGDLFAFLSLTYPDDASGGFSILLNRSGKTASNPIGYADSGLMQVTFSDRAANGDVHFYHDLLDPNGGPLTGVWQPDGRNVNPLGVEGDEARDALLNSFLESLPNGTWTLFLADLSEGGGVSQVESWGIELTIVPEPANWLSSLMVGTLALSFGLARKLRAIAPRQSGSNARNPKGDSSDNEIASIERSASSAPGGFRAGAARAAMLTISLHFLQDASLRGNLTVVNVLTTFIRFT